MGVEKQGGKQGKRIDNLKNKGVGNFKEKGEQRIIIRVVGRATQKGKRVEFV